MKPHSQPCGTCGASSQRSACLPMLRTSPSASARAGRSARSFTDTMAATWPQTGTAPRRGGEEVVQRAAFVGFDVREGDVAQARQRQHLADRLGDEREHAARAGVEEQRLVVDDQVLVEVEAGAAGDVRPAC